jgi:hypothetical protein
MFPNTELTPFAGEELPLAPPAPIVTVIVEPKVMG